MSITNTILLIVGVIVTIIGLAAFFNPNLTRIINAPGGPKIKAVICAITGVIITLIGLIIEIPG